MILNYPNFYLVNVEKKTNVYTNAVSDDYTISMPNTKLKLRFN
jgi:hypothetical protein